MLGYTGLINANVSLLDIALDLGLGSVDELLSTNVNAGTFLIAAGHVLAADGNSNANILNVVAAKLGGVSINLGSLISVEPGVGAAETATINALDLLAGTILIANGSNALSIPSLATNLPLSGTGLTTSLSLIEKARHKCGKKGAAADTAQLSASINGNIVSGQSVLGLPLTGTTAIAVTAASAHGVLTDVICGDETAASPSGEDVQVTSGVVGASAQLNLSVNATTSGTGNLDNGLIAGITSLLNLLGLNKIASLTISGSIGLRASTGDPSTIRTAQIRVPNNADLVGQGRLDRLRRPRPQDDHRHHDEQHPDRHCEELPRPQRVAQREPDLVDPHQPDLEGHQQRAEPAGHRDQHQRAQPALGRPRRDRRRRRRLRRAADLQRPVAGGLTPTT